MLVITACVHIAMSRLKSTMHAFSFLHSDKQSCSVGHNTAYAFVGCDSAWCCAVPSSQPVDVPIRRRSTSEDRLSGGPSRVGSTERSLLSQQMRQSSDKIHQMTNGGAHLASSSLDDLDPLAGGSRQELPFTPSPMQESISDSTAPMLNGGMSKVLSGQIPEQHAQQSLHMDTHQLQLPPSIPWETKVFHQTKQFSLMYIPSSKGHVIDHCCNICVIIAAAQQSCP